MSETTEQSWQPPSAHETAEALAYARMTEEARREHCTSEGPSAEEKLAEFRDKYLTFGEEMTPAAISALLLGHGKLYEVYFILRTEEIKRRADEERLHPREEAVEAAQAPAAGEDDVYRLMIDTSEPEEGTAQADDDVYDLIGDEPSAGVASDLEAAAAAELKAAEIERKRRIVEGVVGDIHDEDVTITTGGMIGVADALDEARGVSEDERDERARRRLRQADRSTGRGAVDRANSIAKLTMVGLIGLGGGMVGKLGCELHRGYRKLEELENRREQTLDDLARPEGAPPAREAGTMGGKAAPIEADAEQQSKRGR